ncbi:hypothetical protein GCM10023262_02610 [Bartonella pachyuromydis]|uniref:Uncharacterized protein n=1 Tax=Bartonella pachyuromydis TaxID=931097 RepID=A0ABP8VDP6_9HYPH
MKFTNFPYHVGFVVFLNDNILIIMIFYSFFILNDKPEYRKISFILNPFILKQLKLFPQYYKADWRVDKNS